MTATVLSYDLSLRGYRTLDLGHIEMETSEITSVPHKFTNEAINGNKVEKTNNEKY